MSLKFSVSLSGSCKKTVYLFNTTYILEHLIFLSYVVCHHNVCLPSINIYFEERFIFLPSKFGVPVGLCVVGLFAASTTSKYISCRNKYNNTTQHNTTQHNTTQGNLTVPSLLDMQNLQVFRQAIEVYLSLFLQNIGQWEGLVT